VAAERLAKRLRVANCRTYLGVRAVAFFFCVCVCAWAALLSELDRSRQQAQVDRLVATVLHLRVGLGVLAALEIHAALEVHSAFEIHASLEVHAAFEVHSSFTRLRQRI